MFDFFRTLSKHTLALLILGVGIVLIVASDPPVTVCGQQVKDYEASQHGYLVRDSTNKARQTARFDRLLGICKEANSLGGCYELFSTVRESLERARLVSLECLGELGTSSLFEKFMKRSVDILVKLAWGEKPPASSAARTGWMEAAQVDLFCRLQDFFVVVYGEGPWANLREQYLQTLPGAAEVGREEAWGRSLLSVTCGGGF